MNVKEIYEYVGGSYDEIIERLGRDEVVETFFQTFLEEPCYECLLAATAQGDIEQSYVSAHNLKSIAGNMGFTALYKADSELVDQLRPRDVPADEGLLERVITEYEKIEKAVQGI